MRAHYKMTRDFEKMHDLHKKAFPGEEPREFESGDICWIIYDSKGMIIGFCSVKPVDSDSVFLSRAGIFRKGQGLHRDSIKYRLKWIKRQGYAWALTYASTDNHPSVANLIRCGFELYDPDWAYCGRKGFLYFRKKLDN